MHGIITDSLNRSLTYTEYRDAIAKMLADKKLDGAPPDDLIHYTILNETLMNRLEKTIEITDGTKAALTSLKNDYVWLVLSEGWCGDAAQILPILHKMEETSARIT